MYNPAQAASFLKGIIMQQDTYLTSFLVLRKRLHLAKPLHR